MTFDRATRMAASLAVLALVTGSVHASPVRDTDDDPKVVTPVGPTLYGPTVDARTLTMRSLLDTAADEDLIAKADAEAIAAFYKARGFAPVWVEDGALTDDAISLIVRIKDANTDGLDPVDYRLPRQSVGRYQAATPLRAAEADLTLSQAVIDYARDAYGGRLEPTELSGNFGYERKHLKASDVLGLVSRAPEPAVALAAYNPPQPEFGALRAALADARAKTAAEEKPEIPGGPLIKAGMTDLRVPMIRERLELASAVEDPNLYGGDVVAAIKAFQKQSRLKADGIVGKRTLAAFNRGPRNDVAIILANMERWRWMPRHLGDFYVRVNVPNYNLDIYKNDEVVHTTRVVVGKTIHQTPVFSDEIEHVVVNPVWNVPASIARNEMLPKLRAGSRLRGYKVYANVRGRFRAVNPRTINWRRVNMSRIQIKQPPGSRNALGQVKFLFPNKYAVYLHDTPSKSLFERETRAFSHGCVRVHQPWDFADALLAHTPGVEGERLRKMVGGGEKWVNLEQTIPVHVTYFTAWIDDRGNLQVRDDIYGHDKRVAKALGLS
ncbi:L,D-transpeptidase family protein [Bauldia sp.]|uniref:L,D-transpeptidase family protein n=1 Tax=Bauldia sp. TaxID=2575872 RepID=UPI003BAAE811